MQSTNSEDRQTWPYVTSISLKNRQSRWQYFVWNVSLSIFVLFLLKWDCYYLSSSHVMIITDCRLTLWRTEHYEALSHGTLSLLKGFVSTFCPWQFCLTARFGASSGDPDPGECLNDVLDLSCLFKPQMTPDILHKIFNHLSIPYTNTLL